MIRVWTKAVSAAGAVVLVFACGAHAQQGSTQHAPDGGSVEMIQNISILPLTGAPFTAAVTTDVTRTLADGSTSTVKNRRVVARDSTGRIFQQPAVRTSLAVWYASIKGRVDIRTSEIHQTFYTRQSTSCIGFARVIIDTDVIIVS